MNCNNCEKPKVCPDDCGMYQDLEGEYLELKKNYYWLMNAYFEER